MIVLLLSVLFTFVELNGENLFDTSHDSLKNDLEFTPESDHHWTRTRYWRKLNNISRELIALGEHPSQGWQLPDMVALCEVENDSVMRDLTRRSLLRKAGYEYVMTDSPDMRGVDVALMYNPHTFFLLGYDTLRVNPLPDMRPTRDILYVRGLTLYGDTLHVFVLHAPSRMGGERVSRPFRMTVARRLSVAVDSLLTRNASARVIVAGDFNDYADSPAPLFLCQRGLENVSSRARGSHGAKGTYRYRGEWHSLDHILCSPSLARQLKECFIGDLPFLLEEDTKYGGTHPFRTYLGPRYQAGYSDHLPLVARFEWEEESLSVRKE